jgi:hypothetical protein
MAENALPLPWRRNQTVCQVKPSPRWMLMTSPVLERCRTGPGVCPPIFLIHDSDLDKPEFIPG